MSYRSLKISQRDNTKGYPLTPVQFIEYGDYECPYSCIGYRFAEMLLRKKAEQIYFAFRNFPLRNIHPHAQRCAEAALAAKEQHHFWRWEALLKRNFR